MQTQQSLKNTVNTAACIHPLRMYVLVHVQDNAVLLASVNCQLAEMRIPSQTEAELVGKLVGLGPGVKDALMIMASAMAFFKVGAAIRQYKSVTVQQ